MRNKSCYYRNTVTSAHSFCCCCAIFIMQWYRRQIPVLSTTDRASVSSGHLLLPLIMLILVVCISGQEWSLPSYLTEDSWQTGYGYWSALCMGQRYQTIRNLSTFPFQNDVYHGLVKNKLMLCWIVGRLLRFCYINTLEFK